MPIPYTPTPNTCTENDVEIETVKWNGENWISASKPSGRSLTARENPKKYSACVPNCTVLW